jgi:predicted CXXCH cytochrome family protein
MECHEEKDMAAVKGHAGIGNKSCVTCHDPHQGKDKYFLKGDLAKSIAPPAPTAAPPKEGGKK